jgi:hypothetical protein
VVVVVVAMDVGDFFTVVVVVFFTVVVVVFFFAGTGRLTAGRRVLTLRFASECQRTRAPGAGDWWSTTTHFLAVLPGPKVVKNSCAFRMATKTRARFSPMRRGIARGPRVDVVEVVRVACACHATTMPGAGHWAVTVTQVAFALPGPRVWKYKSSALMMAKTRVRGSPMRRGIWRGA